MPKGYRADGSKLGFQKERIPWNKGKTGYSMIKKGIYDRNKYQKEYRHRIGKSKTYKALHKKVDGVFISKTKEYKRLYRKRYKYSIKQVDELSIKTIQLVYEDNIKQFGTLTCYLCLQPVPFRKDHLEHKIPLVRGGTNEYNNLAISCQKCNCKKHTKTEAEYRKVGYLS